MRVSQKDLGQFGTRRVKLKQHSPAIKPGSEGACPGLQAKNYAKCIAAADHIHRCKHESSQEDPASMSLY